MPQLEWKHLTGRAIDALDRDTTVVLVTASPLEVHGPHLPTITDIAESEGLTTKVIELLERDHPETTFLRLPPIYAAADVLPHVGSIAFRQSTIRAIFEDLGRSLCRQGFRRIWVNGFHGGPRHFTPIEVAAERVNRRHGGEMISVFSLLMQWLTGGRTDLSELLAGTGGLTAEQLQGDAHGGCIETSLMLHLLGEHVDPCWKTLDRNTVARWLERNGRPALPDTPRPSLPQLFRMFREKLFYYHSETWSGDPSLASAELGERFLDIIAEQGALALGEVLRGERDPANCHAPTWSARWIFDQHWIGRTFEKAVGYDNRVW